MCGTDIDKSALIGHPDEHHWKFLKASAAGAIDGLRFMMERLKNWLKDRFSAGDPSPRQEFLNTVSIGTAEHEPGKQAPHVDPEYVDIDPTLHGKVESQGPGKNVLIRNRYVREETGTHETLKILDDSMVDSGEETGIDPYNTGGFDRSKKWDQRFRK